MPPPAIRAKPLRIYFPQPARIGGNPRQNSADWDGTGEHFSAGHPFSSLSQPTTLPRIGTLSPTLRCFSAINDPCNYRGLAAPAPRSCLI